METAPANSHFFFITKKKDGTSETASFYNSLKKGDLNGKADTRL